MIVLGIDPGSRVTGYGLVECGARGATPRAYGTLRAPAGETGSRLHAIGRGLAALLETHPIDAIGLEQAFHARSARATLVLGQVRGVALWLAAEAGLPVFEFAPRAVKLSVTGRGSASKLQVADMVRR